MPTGYTYKIDDGSVTDIKGFAILCARAFGACIDMRDHPIDAPIPTEFKASDYNAKALDKARAELQEFENLSVDQKRAKFQADAATQQAKYDKRVEEYLATKARYDAMTAEVMRWTPPTEDHEGLKAFMLEQLETGKPFQPAPFSPPVFELWCDDWGDTLKRMIIYHAKSSAEEQQRTAKRNKWLRDLRVSLGLEDGSKLG